MKLAILSRNSSLYSTRRLLEAARALGHQARILDPLRCYMRIDDDRFCLQYKGRPILGYDAVLPRIGHSVTRYGVALVRQFEILRIYTPNPSQAILQARDKLYTQQLLTSAGIPMPTTVFGDQMEDSKALLELLGPAPHVIKMIQGSQGTGVILTDKLSASLAVIDALRGLQAEFLVQSFVKGNHGQDLRCFVIGDQVVASMLRSAKEGDFRANLSQGGSAQVATPTPLEQELAVKAAQILGLSIAGVDIIRSHYGPVVLEVNATPGLEGIETVHSKNIAESIIAFIENKVAQKLQKTSI